ncbi:MAG: putative DNA-binding domain-containing protein [Hyphomicrobiaceae bacterium]|nr:putative DNA-binding domain-containing protein [Hyphomicrobiaceae bacterium]
MAEPLEQRFSSALLDPRAAIPAGIRRADGGDPAFAFAVYRNNVAVSLVETLAAGFPAVRALLGEARFKAVALDFVRREPPRSPVLLRYGATFPQALGAREDLAAIPFLADLAALEWARIEAHHAADAAPAAIADLAVLGEAALGAARLTLHPSVRLVRSRFPIVTIHAIETGGIERPRHRIDLGTGQDALVVRPGMRVAVHPLSEGLGAFVEALVWGAPLGDALEAGINEDASFDASGALQLVFSAGAVEGVEQGEQDA